MTTLNSPALTGGGRMRGPAPDVAGRSLPRTFVVVSIVLHILAFVFAVGVPRWLSSGPSGNKVYVVDLVDLPGSPAATPAPPAPPAAAPAQPEPPKPAPPKAPETKKPEIKEPPKKAPPKPIVLPEKNAPKKTIKTPEKVPEKKVPEPQPKPEKTPEKETDESAGEEAAADAAPQTQTASIAPTTPVKPEAVPGALPGAGTGAGGPGGGSGNGGGDELSFYYALVKKRIETVWKRPVSTSREVRSAAVYIELSSTGRLIKLELRTPSGFAPFDRSIIQAVRDAEPFPPFPVALKMDRLTPTLEFELTPLSGDAPP